MNDSRSHRWAQVLALWLLLGIPVVSAAETANPVVVLDMYCAACHGPEKREGGVRFDAMETIDTVDLQVVFAKAREALHLKEMPPEDSAQPSDVERAALLAWVSEQLTGEAAQKLEEKLRRPDAGNYVDHDDLFSGKYADLPGFTEDRRWLISQYIFDAKFNRILKHAPSRDIDGKRHQVIGDNHRGGINLTNPFLLPDHAGIRYYANEALGSGHLQTMLVNAKDASAAMMNLAVRDARYLPAVSQIMAMEDKHKATLASRRMFLDTHIERVLEDVFNDRHEALLPEFVRVQVPPPAPQ